MLSVQERIANSFYLAFKQFPPFEELNHIDLQTADDVYEYLRDNTPRDAALMLSSGRDSAIMASLMPNGTVAYTARCEGRRDESGKAAQIAERLGLRHRIVTIKRKDYTEAYKLPEFQADPTKFCPWTFKVASAALRDGYTRITSAEGTLAYFGEDAHFHDYADNPSLFFREWSVQIPEEILKEPYPVEEICSDYVVDGHIDTAHFMSLDRGARVIADHTIKLAGLEHISPFHVIRVPLDVERAKREGKYLLAELYERIFGEKCPPKGTPAVVNYQDWLAHYTPSHPNFKDKLPHVEGIRLWQLYKLEQYWRLKCT